jgi:class 3 adenylate cyclase/tetratricopeptide (TPR) repeat protein
VSGPHPETVTVLFSDVVGSTAFRTRVGDGPADDCLLELERASRQIVSDHNGVVVKGLGDGVMATFSSAVAALDAAVALQGAAHFLYGMGGVQLRLGVSSGDMVREGADWHGMAATEASRLCAEAAAGSVLVSATTALLARGRAQYELLSLGGRRLRGFDTPIEVFEVTPPQDDDVPAALAGVIPARMVGRSLEIASGSQMLEALAAGRPWSLLLVGEPGVGKSSLAGAIGQAAAALGFVVLYGHCDEGVRAPYQPVIEAFGSWLAACPDVAMARILGEGAAELTRLWPDLARRAPGLAVLPDAEPETQRWRLFDAVAALASVIAADRGLVVVIDDLHWSDPATVALLRHLCDPSVGRVGVVATARNGEADGDTRFLFNEFATARNVRLLSLAGLEAAEVGDFVALHTGAVPPDDFSRWLKEETDGNPFFLQALLTQLAETNSLHNADGEWLTEGELTELGVPSAARDVIERRLSRLGPRQRQTLDAAAVVGQAFDVTMVASVLGFGLDETIDALDRAVTSGVLREQGPGRLGFVHALVRHAVVANLSLTRLARLHWRVAEEIERTASDVSSRLGEVAYHYAAGADIGDPAVITRSAIAAGDDAMRRLAFEDATRQFRVALAALERMTSNPGTRFQVLISLASALNALTLPDSAEPLWLEAGELARQRGDPDGLFRAFTGYSYILRVDSDPHAGRLLDELLALLPPGDSPVRARALAWKAAQPSGLDRDLAAQAVAMARRTGDADAVTGTLASTVFLESYGSNASAMLEAAEDLYQTPKAGVRFQSGNGWWVARLLAWARLRVGRRADAERALAECRELAAETRHGIALHNTLLWGASLATAEGRFTDAKRIAAEAQERGGPHNMTVALGYGAQILAARMEQGAVDKVIGALRAIDLVLDQLPGWRAMLAGAFADAGQQVAAAAELDRTLAGADSPLPPGHSAPLAVRYLPEVCRQLNDTSTATALLPHVEPWAGQFLVVSIGTSIEGASDRSLGHLLTTLGRFDEADAAYHAAAELERSAAFRPLPARTQYWHARMLLERRGGGDRDRALALLEDVTAVTGELGMHRLGEQAAALLQVHREPAGRTSKQ